MNDVLEEVTSETITKDHVTKRVNDWVDRLNELYVQLKSWLPKGWHVDRQHFELMDEKMMQRFKIRPRKIPILDLKSDAGRSASLKPRGLWIIGVNGRVDMIVSPKHFLIVDRAKNFAPAEWHIINFYDRDEDRKLSKSTLANALIA